MQAVVQSLTQGLSTLFSYIPQLIGAIIVLIIGYIIARIIQAVVTRVLKSVGFEDWMERGGVKQFFDRAQTNQTPSSILGKVAFWFIFIIAITMAANALGIQQISGFLNQLIAYIPSIFAAILILFLAALLANFVAGIVRGATGSEILASVTRYGIIIYAVFAALTQLGIAVHLTSNTFLILLAGVALAASIAFGLGSRNVAQDIVERAYNRRDEARERIEEQRRRQGRDSGNGSTGEGRRDDPWEDDRGRVRSDFPTEESRRRDR